MERYEQKAAEKAAMRSNIDSVKFMITKLNADKNLLLSQYTQEEYDIALKELSEENTDK